MCKKYSSIILFSVLAYSNLSYAGGPSILEGPGGNTPVTYQNPAITLHVEDGTLGTLSNTDANIFINEAFSLWNNVNTSTINLTIDTALINTDINISNFESYIPDVDGTVFHSDDNLNPVVYDNNGEIIDAYFGIGASEDIIGFAASIYTFGSSYFDEGYAVINGKDLGLTNTTFKLLIAHEIGHFFGLDHTQVNIDNQETYPGFPRFCSTSNLENYPLMYPFVCRDVESLHADDVSAVSALYPETNINDNFGILEGRFLDQSGNPVLGANIWVENTVTGETYSVISDYLKQGTGYYKLYLPAGTYTLHANSINPEFNGGSGIGPYSSTILDISFIEPHPISPVTYQDETTGNDVLITISLNQTMDINFSCIDCFAPLPAVSSSDEDDSFADLFGATSHVTLALLFSLLMTARRISPRSNHGNSNN
jgi:hypothetical protein